MIKMIDVMVIKKNYVYVYEIHSVNYFYSIDVSIVFFPISILKQTINKVGILNMYKKIYLELCNK